MKITNFLFFFFISISKLTAQTVTVSTFAGTGARGSNNGPKNTSTFQGPYGIAKDIQGNIYFSDYGNNKIRKISTDGIVSTLAGTGAAGSNDGNGDVATFNRPYGIDVDAQGNVYVADNGNNKIRKITPAGVVSTFAGSGTQGKADGLGTTASFYEPWDICIDPNGNLYVADKENHLIRKITPAGLVSTFAGRGTPHLNDGIGTLAGFNRPMSITIDNNGTLYVVDYGNNRIRKITTSLVVTTIAGSGVPTFADGNGSSASFKYPQGITVDQWGDLYIADAANQRIRRITPNGEVTTIAGTGDISFNNGTGDMAQFASPIGIEIDTDGSLYVADYHNNRIRKLEITKGAQTISGLSNLTKLSNDLPFNLSGVASSGATVVYSSNNTAVVSVTSNTVTINGSGTATITASQVGNNFYNAASNVSFTITVNQVVNDLLVNDIQSNSGIFTSATILNGGKLTLNDNITVSGTLTVKSGGVLDLNNYTFSVNAVVFEDGAVVIESGNAGSSKLSSATPILYNRTQSHGGYTYISSPFTSATGASGFYYNESGRTGNDYLTGWKNASGNFELGKGYAINGLGTKQITGNQLNNGTVSVTTTSTPTDANTDHNGWNLLGNPYLAPIDVASFLGSNVYPAVYIWNGSNYNTKVSGVIPAGQGFFVQEFSPSNTATFESSFINAALNNSLLRVQNTEEKLSLKLSGANADNTDLYFVASNNVSDNYDITKDALKLFENAVSEIFTLASSKQLAINYLQSNNLDKEILVGVTLTKSGTYSIGIDANNSKYSQVLLKDNVTGTLNDITFNPFTFSTNSTGKVADRFVLQLPAARLTGIESATTQLNKAYDNGQFAIVIEGEFEQVNVIDLTGKHIYSGNAKTISVSNTGLYLVEILNGANKNVQKVLVK